MTAFEDIAGDASRLIREAIDETSGMRQGVIPSIPILQGMQAQLVEVYYRLGELVAGAFSQKETANIERKVFAARAHLKGRNEFSMTQEDAKQSAIEATKEQYQEELKAMDLYEHSRILRDSVGHVIDAGHGVSERHGLRGIADY